jgi:hypothetical protein
LRIILGQFRGLLISGLIFVFIVSVVVIPKLPALGVSLAEADPVKDHSGALDHSMYRTVSERAAPVISCNTDKICKASETVMIKNVFRAIDTDGQSVHVQVDKITDAVGNDLTGSYVMDSDSITFQKAGVYYFVLQAMDNERKKVKKELPFVVDSKEGI